jgi:hypothetical protein
MGVAIMADGPLAGVFWRVLNALDYSDAGEFVAGGRGLCPFPDGGAPD